MVPAERNDQLIPKKIEPIITAHVLYLCVQRSLNTFKSVFISFIFLPFGLFLTVRRAMKKVIVAITAKANAYEFIR